MITTSLFLLVAILSLTSSQLTLSGSCSDKIGVATDEHYIQAVYCWLSALPKKEGQLGYHLNLTLALREPLDGWKFTVQTAYHQLQLGRVEMNSPLGTRDMVYDIQEEAVTIQDDSIVTDTLQFAFWFADNRLEISDEGTRIWPVLLHLQCLHCTSTTEEQGVSAQMCSGDKFHNQATVRPLVAGKTPSSSSLITVHRSHPLLSNSPSSCSLEMHISRVHSTTGCSLLQVNSTHYVLTLGNRKTTEATGTCILKVSYLHPSPLSSFPVMCTTCNDMTNTDVSVLKRRSTGDNADCDDEDNDCPSWSGSATEDAESGNAMTDTTTQVPSRLTEVPDRRTKVPKEFTEAPSSTKEVFSIGTEIPSRETSNETEIPSKGTEVPNSGTQPATTSPITINDKLDHRPTSSDSDETDTSPTSSSPVLNNLATPRTKTTGDDDIIRIITDTPTRDIKEISTTRRTSNSPDPSLAEDTDVRKVSVTSSGVWIGLGTAVALLLLCAVIVLVIILSRRKNAAKRFAVTEEMVTENTPKVYGNTDTELTGAIGPTTQKYIVNEGFGGNTADQHYAAPPPPYAAITFDTDDPGYCNGFTAMERLENDDGQTVTTLV